MAMRKRQNDKQRSTKNTHKTKDRVARTPLKLGWTQVLWMGKQVRYVVCEIKWMSGMKLMQILEITLYTYNQGHIDVIQYTNILK